MQQTQPSRAARGRGFTLVELVTAAALMTIVMLGVVQVFAMISETAAQTEAASFAQQQMRALFDNLNRDVRGMTHEGFLRIAANMCNEDVNKTSSTVFAAPVNKQASYAVNTLGFASIGTWRGINWVKDSNLGAATAAEVFYTAYVKTPTAFRKFGTTTVENIQRGVLGRGVWVMDGNPGTDSDPDLDQRSKASFLCDLPTKRRTEDYMVIYPWLIKDASAPAQHAETLRRVMATCVSEFYVEYWHETVSGGTLSGEWLNQTATWTQSSSVWPKAIRVTVAVHDPSDVGSTQTSVAGSRYQGYALQEVFWIGDP